MRIIVGIVGLLIFWDSSTEGACPANTNVLQMCYGGTRDGTDDVYLETSIPDGSAIKECSCTVTTSFSGSGSAQVDFIPQFSTWLVCYYKQVIRFERATGTYSCDGGNSRPTSFFDMKDNSSATVSLEEDFKSGSSAVDSCLQIKAFTNGVNLRVTCSQVSGIPTTTSSSSTPTTTTTQQTTTTTETTTTQQTTTTPDTTTTQQTTTTPEMTTTQQSSTDPATTATQQTFSTPTPTMTSTQQSSTDPATTTTQEQTSSTPTTTITSTQQTVTDPTTTTTQQTTTTLETTTTQQTVTDPTTTITQQTSKDPAISLTSPALLATTMKQTNAPGDNKSGFQGDPSDMRGEVTKTQNEYIIPIGVGVGSFLLLVAFLAVVLCNKCKRHRSASDVENDNFLNSDDDATKEFSSPIYSAPNPKKDGGILAGPGIFHSDEQPPVTTEANDSCDNPITNADVENVPVPDNDEAGVSYDNPITNDDVENVPVPDNDVAGVSNDNPAIRNDDVTNVPVPDDDEAGVSYDNGADFDLPSPPPSILNEDN